MGVSRVIALGLRSGRLQWPPKALEDIGIDRVRAAESAAADYLEAGLAEPAPVAGVSAAVRARLRQIAESLPGGPWENMTGAVLSLLAALEQAERERDEARRFCEYAENERNQARRRKEHLQDKNRAVRRLVKAKAEESTLDAVKRALKEAGRGR